MGSPYLSPAPEPSDYREDMVITEVSIPTDMQSDVYAVGESPLYFLEVDDDNEETREFDMVPIVAEDQAIHPSEIIHGVHEKAEEVMELSDSDVEILSDDCLMENSDEDQ